MKRRIITASETVTIKTAVEEGEVYDRSIIETIAESDIFNKYKEHLEKHKNAILDMAVSRLALDSAMNLIENSIGTLTNGKAIEINTEEISEKIDTIFERGILLHAYNAALQSAVDDTETRKELMLKYVADGKLNAPAPNPNAIMPLARLSKEAIEKDIDIIRDSLGTSRKKDESTNPFGVMNEKKADGKLVVNHSKSPRGRRVSRRGRNK